jgi:hypothetical protein
MMRFFLSSIIVFILSTSVSKGYIIKGILVDTTIDPVKIKIFYDEAPFIHLSRPIEVLIKNDTFKVNFYSYTRNSQIGFLITQDTSYFLPKSDYYNLCAIRASSFNDISTHLDSNFYYIYDSINEYSFVVKPTTYCLPLSTSNNNIPNEAPYPNPVYNTLYIKEQPISVNDFLGRHMPIQYYTDQLNVSAYHAGCYFLKTSSGYYKFVKKE